VEILVNMPAAFFVHNHIYLHECGGEFHD